MLPKNTADKLDGENDKTRAYCTYNTLFSREEIFAKSEFEIFSREDIFANIGLLFTRKYLPAKITPREKIFLQFFAVPQICRLA